VQQRCLAATFFLKHTFKNNLSGSPTCPKKENTVARKTKNKKKKNKDRMAEIRHGGAAQ